MEHREESDQLPEEAPPGQVTDDEGLGAGRDEAKESAGGADDDERQTGNRSDDEAGDND